MVLKPRGFSGFVFLKSLRIVIIISYNVNYLGMGWRTMHDSNKWSFKKLLRG